MAFALSRQKTEEISRQKRYDALTEGAGVATAARPAASLFGARRARLMVTPLIIFLNTEAG